MGMGIEELEDRINQMRKILILIAKETGLDSNDTLLCSRKLDKLITLYQKGKINKIQKFD
ncbi:aspartyl-phosphate phosphatase Spo0E family protein [Neobacillus niacini]|uniref:aspartyl-phosphate phosphatase Spo0E family protein n=1 Tax=Neobacillus niacini TaxID=86668 RepID=UPI0027D85DD6|nr:aspartyl-phosphate phosphatase Spo0E family protein [Neobacillus niacini]